MSLPLSIVIPTHHRPSQLAATLDALAEQCLAGEKPGTGFEVVIVDDGSCPPAELPSGATGVLSCRWLRQEKRGPATARNRGIAAATGERIVLLGDDTRPAPGALESHLRAARRAHPQSEVGVQGRIDWDPAQPITPLMQFLAPSGPQFYFDGLEDGSTVPYSAVLGSNYSAPRQWFLEEPFDESFPTAAFEDTELAYRFELRGWPSIYASDAHCWHDHHYEDIGPFLKRQRRAGRAARHAVQRHAALLPKVVLQPALMAPWVFLRHTMSLDAGRRQRGRWDLRCRWHFLAGFLGR